MATKPSKKTFPMPKSKAPAKGKKSTCITKEL